MQQILVILSLVLAVAYIARILYTQFFSKSDNCAGCAVMKLKEEKR